MIRNILKEIKKQKEICRKDLKNISEKFLESVSSKNLDAEYRIQSNLNYFRMHQECMEYLNELKEIEYIYNNFCPNGIKKATINDIHYLQDGSTIYIIDSEKLIPTKYMAKIIKRNEDLVDINGYPFKIEDEYIYDENGEILILKDISNNSLQFIVSTKSNLLEEYSPVYIDLK